MAWPNVYSLEYHHLEEGGPSPPSQPTIVLVHDAFYVAQHLEKLAGVLRAANWRVLVPQLPSFTTIGEENAFEADVRAIWEQVLPELESGRDVVIVLHGFSGLTGSVAAERLNQHAFTRPRAGFVDKIIFVAGLVAGLTESSKDIYKPEWLLQDGRLLGVRKMDEVFFHDCTIEVAQRAMVSMRPQLVDLLDFKVTSPGWQFIDCAYIVCAADNAIPPRWQLACARKLQGPNRQTAVHSIDAGHSPFLSKTEELATTIAEVIAPR